jgi:hypothetical protein
VILSVIFERPCFVTLCYDCEHMVCSVNDHFQLMFLVILVVKAREEEK